MILGQEDPLEEGMVTHSNILAWRILWAEEHREIQSAGLQFVQSSLIIPFTTKWVLMPNRLSH